MELKCYGDYTRVPSSNALETLNNKTGQGSEYLGWVDLPENPPNLDEIIKATSKLKQKADALLVIGIGGSYLGAKAGIEYLFGTNHNETDWG